jgi:hypothetical protein
MFVFKDHFKFYHCAISHRIDNVGRTIYTLGHPVQMSDISTKFQLKINAAPWVHFMRN